MCISQRGHLCFLVGFVWHVVYVFCLYVLSNFLHAQAEMGQLIPGHDCRVWWLCFPKGRGSTVVKRSLCGRSCVTIVSFTVDLDREEVAIFDWISLTLSRRVVVLLHAIYNPIGSFIYLQIHLLVVPHRGYGSTWPPKDNFMQRGDDSLLANPPSLMQQYRCYLGDLNWSG